MTLPVTAITVSYNSAAVLPACISALRKHLVPDQLVVVDNASSDGSARVASEHGAEVIVNPVNQGFGAGCNLGAKTLIDNPDVCVMFVDPVTLQKLAERRPLGLIAARALLVERAAYYEPG